MRRLWLGRCLLAASALAPGFAAWAQLPLGCEDIFTQAGTGRRYLQAGLVVKSSAFIVADAEKKAELGPRRAHDVFSLVQLSARGKGQVRMMLEAASGKWFSPSQGFVQGFRSFVGDDDIVFQEEYTDTRSGASYSYLWHYPDGQQDGALFHEDSVIPVGIIRDGRCLASR